MFEDVERSLCFGGTWELVDGLPANSLQRSKNDLSCGSFV